MIVKRVAVKYRHDGLLHNTCLIFICVNVVKYCLCVTQFPCNNILLCLRVFLYA